MTPSVTSTTGVPIGSREDRDYDAFRARVQARFLANLAAGDNALFTTDAERLFQTYLDFLPEADRQHHTCHACRRFIETYGGLVTINAEGRTTPAIWAAEDAPDYYRPAIEAVARVVRRARVAGVFRSKEPVWGQPITGEWTHYSVSPPVSILHSHALLTAGQAMAEKLEDYRTVQRALADFDAAMLDTVMRLLESEAMYRSEKVIGPARWLRDLRKARDAAPKDLRDNIVWKAVATAPSGFCHPRSSMVGTLLEDVAAGMGFEEVSRRFAAKMHPLQYQRPQAAPSAGNIVQAERIFETMGLAASLKRRFARLDDVTDAIWRPSPPKAADKPVGAGVFSHLTPKGAAPTTAMSLPTQTMTWAKFQATVLPTAESIEFHVPFGVANFGALTTAVDPDAPPILQWDRPDRRNPVSGYVYHGGSHARQWGLTAGSRCNVVAIVANPASWHGGDLGNFGESFQLLLSGSAETRASGLAIFPENLRSELREVRSTIEAHSRYGSIEGLGEPMACGPIFGKGNGAWDCTITVAADGHKRTYKLDRWD